MKPIGYVLVIASIFFLGFSTGKKASNSLIEEKKMTQVGIVVKDIEQASRAWANFLGIEEVPKINIASGHDSRPTNFRGERINATAKLAFFQLDNITIELIEPLDGPSTWGEFLEEHGPGIHHVAFHVGKMKHTVPLFEKNGIMEVQHGGWGTGEYAYMDGLDSLGLIIELLEHYRE